MFLRAETRLKDGKEHRSAMGDLLGEDFGLVQIDKLYRCLDKLLPHKRDLFTYLRQRWQALFHMGFEVLLYDLTSTYFESEPPEGGLRKFGYSRDKRPDCVQVVIALIVTPEGFPLAYEVMPGNTLDKTTLGDFLKSIEQQYGKAQRTWVMDRGIPTEETLSRMRTAETPIHYLVGTPRGRLSKLETAFLTLPWEQVRDSVEVKLIEQAGELYILSRSGGRVHKERAMRRRRLKRLWKRLRELQQQKLTRDDLLLKLGAAKKEAGQAYRLVNLHLPAKEPAGHPSDLHLCFEQKQTPHRSAPRRELLAPLQSHQRTSRSLVAVLHPVSGLLTPSCYSGDGGGSGWVLTWNGNSASICSRVWALGNSVKRWRR